MSDNPRYFTFEEASRTLPLVTRIVRDIVEAYPGFQQRLNELERLAGTVAPDDIEMTGLRSRVDAEVQHLNGLMAELRQIGCEFKGFPEGLVDFHSMHRGRPILLCWKLGEDRIGFWHEVDAGYAGRQPVTPELIEEIRAEVPARSGG